MLIRKEKGGEGLVSSIDAHISFDFVCIETMEDIFSPIISIIPYQIGERSE